MLTPLGMLTYFAWIGTRLHDYLVWFHVERRFWGTHFDFGVRTFRLVTWTSAGLLAFCVGWWPHHYIGPAP